MPSSIRTHKPPAAMPARHATLKERQGARTLALNGTAWRRLRALVLTEQPLCAHCREVSVLRLASEVDHIDNDPANNDRVNLVGLCKSCHSRKTRRDSNKNHQQPMTLNRWLAHAHATAVKTEA